VAFVSIPQHVVSARAVGDSVMVAGRSPLPEPTPRRGMNPVRLKDIIDRATDEWLHAVNSPFYHEEVPMA
jgi:hypothetical protein